MRPFPILYWYIQGLRAWDIKTYDVTSDFLVIELAHKKLKTEKYFCVHKDKGRYLLTFEQDIWDARIQQFVTIEEQKRYIHESDVKERIKYLLRLQTYK